MDWGSGVTTRKYGSAPNRYYLRESQSWSKVQTEPEQTIPTTPYDLLSSPGVTPYKGILTA